MNVVASREAITRFRAPGHAEYRRLHSATTVLRAYVTSGSPLVTTRAKRHAYALRPHATSCGELEARGTRAARSLRAARTARRRRSRGRARMKAGDSCVAPQAPRPLRWQRSRQRVARWPSSFRRGRAKQHAHGTPRRSRYSEVAPRRIDPASAQDRYVALGRLSVRDRGSKTTLPGLSGRTWRSRLA